MGVDRRFDEKRDKNGLTALERQVKRLRGFVRFELWAEELVRCVRRHAASDEHVCRIVDNIIDTRGPNTDGFAPCPTVAEMADYCHAVPDHPSGLVPADPDCNTCQGTGFEVKEYIMFGEMKTGAQICDCRRQKLGKMPTPPAVIGATTLALPAGDERSKA